MSDFDLESEQPVTAGDSLIAVLDELIETVNNARAVPMSASVMINKSEVLDLLQTARDIVPDQIHAADSIIGEAAEVRAEAQRSAQAISHQAQDEAERIVAEARAEADRLVSEHELTEQARGKATVIISEAEGQADKLGRGANRYSDDVLASLQSNLEQVLSQVKAGRDEISRRSTTIHPEGDVVHADEPQDPEPRRKFGRKDKPAKEQSVFDEWSDDFEPPFEAEPR